MHKSQLRSRESILSIEPTCLRPTRASPSFSFPDSLLLNLLLTTMSTPKDQLKRGIESNLSPETPRTTTGSPAQRTFGQSWLGAPNSYFSRINHAHSASYLQPFHVKLVSFYLVFFSELPLADYIYLTNSRTRSLPTKLGRRRNPNHLPHETNSNVH